jgi:leucyl/phenylalanyl-tRNA--protein transferase
MFHSERDASKVALVHLVELLGGNDDALLDVQWVTPHLATLGAVDIARAEYLHRLQRALQLPLSPAFEVRP